MKMKDDRLAYDIRIIKAVVVKINMLFFFGGGGVSLGALTAF